VWAYRAQQEAVAAEQRALAERDKICIGLEINGYLPAEF
jgi:hypothetical protein